MVATVHVLTAAAAAGALPRSSGARSLAAWAKGETSADAKSSHVARRSGSDLCCRPHSGDSG
eukprot:COSAG02_NODE_32_length_50374_cov_46.674013_14_plen_62_part_00